MKTCRHSRICGKVYILYQLSRYFSTVIKQTIDLIINNYHFQAHHLCFLAAHYKQLMSNYFKAIRQVLYQIVKGKCKRYQRCTLQTHTTKHIMTKYMNITSQDKTLITSNEDFGQWTNLKWINHTLTICNNGIYTFNVFFN